MVRNERAQRLLKNFWFRLAGAVVPAIVALGLSLLLWPIIKPFSTPIFLMAIILSSWIFGFRAGLLSSAICAIAVDYFFVSPVYELVGDRDNLIRYAVFISQGALISWIVDTRRMMAQKTIASEERLSALSLRQQLIVEAERKRIALEIHDELGQVLTGVKMAVYSLNKQVKESPGPENEVDVSSRLEDLSKTVDLSISSVRRIATALRPPILDDLGLIAAMEWQAKEFEKVSGLRCSFRSDKESVNIESEASIAVFRIFQEGLTNIAKHAEASDVAVEIREVDEMLIMKIEDDGKGFNEAGLETSDSLGILGMKERARHIGATLVLESTEEKGVRLELIVPHSEAGRTK